MEALFNNVLWVQVITMGLHGVTKCHSWVTDSKLFATPGNFSAFFHYCFIERIYFLRFGCSQFQHIQCSSFFPFLHIYPFNIDNGDDTRVWNMLSDFVTHDLPRQFCNTRSTGLAKGFMGSGKLS